MQSECVEVSWDGLDQEVRTLRAFLGRRCNDANEADDVVQETLLRAARFRARLVDERNLRPWLLRIAASVLRDHLRRERRRQRVRDSETLLELLAGREGEPGGCECGPLFAIEGQYVQRESLLDELDCALAETGFEERRALAGHYGAGMCREMADPALAPHSPARRKELLYRARQKLHRRLTTRVRCVLPEGDAEPRAARRAADNDRGRVAPANNPETGARCAQRD